MWKTLLTKATNSALVRGQPASLSSVVVFLYRRGLMVGKTVTEIGFLTVMGLIAPQSNSSQVVPLTI